jgi:PhnB protein
MPMEKQGTLKSIKPVPEGFHTVTPFIIVNNAAGLIQFIEKAFGGKQTYITKEDDGKIMHATASIGDSTIMLCDVMEGMPAQTAMLYLYLPDVDRVYQNALKANATSVHEPSDEFYGDRAGAVKDQWGNVWWIATHVEDVDEQEIERRKKIVLKERKEREAVHT